MDFVLRLKADSVNFAQSEVRASVEFSQSGHSSLINVFLCDSIISVVIDSGPRYEVAYPSGVSHFLEKLAFQVSIHSVD